MGRISLTLTAMMHTHKQYSALTVEGNEVLGTRTDYVNKYKSIFQTTSYNLNGTKTTGELCAGVVKAHGIYPKNPVQHAVDLKMLLRKDELRLAFANPDTGLPKSITCVRVDGASDEGPSHLEVQFWWSEYHLSEGNYITLLTSRSSGSSYLNRVELQNGCLAQAHSNVFIPSTLGGSCFNSDTGTIDHNQLKENLELATDVYINRYNQCPCGDTVIQLYRGANSYKWQELRPLLNVFLKGKQQQVNELEQQNPEAYSFFKSVVCQKSPHCTQLTRTICVLSPLLFTTWLSSPSMPQSSGSPRLCHSQCMVSFRTKCDALAYASSRP